MLENPPENLYDEMILTIHSSKMSIWMQAINLHSICWACDSPISFQDK